MFASRAADFTFVQYIAEMKVIGALRAPERNECFYRTVRAGKNFTPPAESFFIDDPEGRKVFLYAFLKLMKYTRMCENNAYSTFEIDYLYMRFQN